MTPEQIVAVINRFLELYPNVTSLEADDTACISDIYAELYPDEELLDGDDLATLWENISARLEDNEAVID